MIWSTFGNVLPEALGIAISPIPIVLVILMLVSVHARVNGPSFLVGWFVGVLLVTGVAYLVADVADAGTDPDASDGVSWFKLLLGLLFIGLAVKQWRGRPQPGVEPPTPKLFSAVDTMGGGKSLGFGFLACVANPKNLPLALSAGASITQAGATGSDGWITVVLFVIVASSTVAAPVIVYFGLGDRADGILASWKLWLIHNNATVMVVLFTILGAKMLGDGLGVFA